MNDTDMPDTVNGKRLEAEARRDRAMELLRQSRELLRAATDQEAA
jgi:hypothetical protein